MRRWRLLILVVLVAGLVWVMRTGRTPHPLYPIREPDPLAADLGSSHEPSRCGTITGRVLWSGPEPVVAPIELPITPVLPIRKKDVPNPNRPRVKDGGLADAIVWLENVDRSRAKPWTLPPVRVALRDFEFVVRQDGAAGRIGIVRRGAGVEFASRESAMHSARGRGAAFFTQMLPEPGKPVTRVLPDNGIVELTSGSGYFWMRGYLFVSDHSYATVTDAEGRFRLDGVPDGDYDLVFWKANWNVARLERDPELIVPVRLEFGPPTVRRQTVSVKAGTSNSVTFSLSAADFGPSR
jgi:hypothetical protein